MKITLICIGKTDDKAILQLMQTYEKRFSSHINYERIELSDIKNRKNLSEMQQKEKEAELILQNIYPTDFVILLDDKGKQFTSIDFAREIQNYMNQSIKNLVFVVGGPYGVSKQVYQRVNYQLSLSKMTFTHQMVRLFMIEQIYRVFTILHGKPYHHE